MNEKEEIRNKIFSIWKEIEEWDNAYYNLDKPIVSDEIYDKRIIELQKLETKYANYFSFDELNNSPTQKINAKASDIFKKVTHNSPMLSLNKAYTLEEIQKFINNIHKITNEYSFFIEPKIDGLSISVKYQNGKLLQAITRGDGIIGEDVTNNIREIDSIPKTISYYNDLEVRGEIYLELDKFEKLNMMLAKENKPLLANPRNAAAGTLRQLDANIVKERKLSAFLYQIVNPENHNIKTMNEVFNFLNALGFQTTKDSKVVKNIEEIKNYIDNFKHIKKTLNYETDGVVIKLNELKYYKTLGSTVKFPHSAIAYKYEPNAIATTIKNIFITVGRTGLVTYNAELEPVQLSGSTISFATLNNFQYINDLKIEIGDLVYIKKAGEIIPCVIGLVNKKTKNSNFKKIEICPFCHNKLEDSKTMLEQYCVNETCPEILRKKLIHFASKDAMEFDSLGEKNINIFINNNLIKTIEDFFRLKNRKNEILKIERFGHKSIMNILSSIEKSYSNSLEKLIFGFSIKHIGTKIAYFLAEKIELLSNFLEFNYDDLLKYNEIGEKIVDSLKKWVSDKKNIETVKNLLEMRLDLKFISSRKTEKFSQMIFVITGTLSQPRSYFENLIKENGGNISNSISSKTSYLLVGIDAGNKLSKAKALNINIINESEFYELLKKN
ncbi:NAD-dependent DNA ligase LigA [Metamycoplasma buccale]|uniref:NAD-dependent DNA ligase LigA n=1 Tax=Metamycoplasma buccale TaxID=55602 RepID=UPI00398E6A60